MTRAPPDINNHFDRLNTIGIIRRGTMAASLGKPGYVMCITGTGAATA